MPNDQIILRPPAEEAYAHELKALKTADKHPKPPNWALSPWAVVTYIIGGKLEDGTEIEPKYYGSRRLIEVMLVRHTGRPIPRAVSPDDGDGGPTRASQAGDDLVLQGGRGFPPVPPLPGALVCPQGRGKQMAKWMGKRSCNET